MADTATTNIVSAGYSLMYMPFCTFQTACIMQETSIIGTIEDFMWLKLHLVQPSSAASMSTSNRQSPTATSSMLSPPYTITTLQVSSCRGWRKWPVFLAGRSLLNFSSSSPLPFPLLLLLLHLILLLLLISAAPAGLEPASCCIIA